MSLVAVLLTAVTGSVSAEWEQLGADIDGDVEGDQSGIAVAVSADGSRLAIGARLHNLAAGQVRVFDWDGAGWVRFNQDILGEAQDDNAGSSVALSADGSRVAVGAWGHDGVGDRSGYVRVFDQSGSTWDQIGDDIEGLAATDFAGAAVALSANGSRVAVGAWGHDGVGTNSGYVRVYEVVGVIGSGFEWQQIGAAIEGDAGYVHLGWSVALSGDGSRLAVGAPSNDIPGTDAGLVRVFRFVGEAPTGSWSQLGSDIAGAPGDELGSAVALSADGSRLAVGAPSANGSGVSSGLTRVFEYHGFPLYDWLQVGSDIDGERAFDESGTAVALSADGMRLAVGAPLNDAGGNPFFVVDTGQVRLFDWEGGTWIQLGADIDGEAADDQSGFAVALSAEGARVAIGARFNDGAGGLFPASGHVRVYTTEIFVDGFESGDTSAWSGTQ